MTRTGIPLALLAAFLAGCYNHDPAIQWAEYAQQHDDVALYELTGKGAPVLVKTVKGTPAQEMNKMRFLTRNEGAELGTSTTARDDGFVERAGYTGYNRVQSDTRMTPPITEQTTYRNIATGDGMIEYAVRSRVVESPKWNPAAQAFSRDETARAHLLDKAKPVMMQRDLALQIANSKQSNEALGKQVKAQEAAVAAVNRKAEEVMDTGAQIETTMRALITKLDELNARVEKVENGAMSAKPENPGKSSRAVKKAIDD